LKDAKENKMNNMLSPLTKFLILISGLVPLIFGVAMFFAPGLVNSIVLYIDDSVPPLVLRYNALSYFALTIGAGYALSRNNWQTASGYLAGAGSYVILSLLLSILAILTTPVRTILYLYVTLALIYTVIFIIVWRQETARNR